MPGQQLFTYRIVYGTPYDFTENYPLDSENIVNHAAIVRTCEGEYAEWGSNGLQYITLNYNTPPSGDDPGFQSYEDCRGAQYIVMYDTTGYFQHHFYMVLGDAEYINANCARFPVVENNLLSMGIQHIREISGDIVRYTPRIDTPWAYASSPEPLDASADLEYQYYIWKPNIEQLQLRAGFPYNMAFKPSIQQYVNADGTISQYWMPSFTSDASKLGVKTIFYSPLNDDNLYIQDGLCYQDYDYAKEAYDACVSLGYDIQAQAYFRPYDPDLCTITTHGEYPSVEIAVRGQSKIYDTGLAIRTGSYAYNKAEEVASSFTLFNPVTGDSVTVDAKDIAPSATGTVQIKVSCDPQIDGRFYASIVGYNDKPDQLDVGVVKSAPFPRYSLSSSAGLGQQQAIIEHVVSVDQTAVSQTNQVASFEQSRDNAFLSTMIDAVNTLGNTAISAASSQGGGAGGSVAGGALSLITGVASYLGITKPTQQTQEDNMNRTMAQQNEQLRTAGNLLNAVPPQIKYGGVNGQTGGAYNFVLCKTYRGAKDRNNLNEFFKRFGYNVVNEPLNNFAQLQAREHFTYIMADNVKVNGVSGGTSLERLRGITMTEQIKQLFASGLRIWRDVPDYTYTQSNNPI